MVSLGLTEILLIVVPGLVIIWIFTYNRKSKQNLPPGPKGLPVVGNIFQLTNNGYLKMAEWAQEYGPMFKIQLGSILAIVINDVKIAKEILSDTNFSARPHIPLQEQLSGGHQGIIITNGTVWEEQRRWTLRKLRDYGFGKTSMESLIMDDVNEVITIFKKTGGEYKLINGIFDLAVLNSLWTLLNGERLGQSDPRIRSIFDKFHNVAEAVANSGLMFAAWLKYIFPSAQKTVDEAADGVMYIAREAVSNHFETHVEGQSRDFIDEYINEIKSTTDTNSSFFQQAGRNNLEGTVSDLIQAGSETTSTSLTWLINYLCENLDAQEKMQQEMDSVVGTSRPIALSDKINLPYTEAVILETLRHSSILANGVVRTAIVDKQVNGYMIPKGAWIMTNLYFIHHDPKIWGDPHNFRPERFLSPDGKKVVRHEALVPFQMGRRQCLGESLARDSLFLFASNVFQRFNVNKLEKGQLEPISGVFLSPRDYHFRFQDRIET